MSVETLTSFRFVPKENPFWNSSPCEKEIQKIQKIQKIKIYQKSTKKWFDRAAFWRLYVYLISSTSMQKENPFWNSVRQIKIRCANTNLRNGVITSKCNYLCSSSLVSVETLTTFRFVPKENPFWNSRPCKKEIQKIQKIQKFKIYQKSTKKWFDRAALWRVYVYLISSSSMQKENPFWNSVRQIKIRCAKYKFAERSHNFLMQLPMQLIFGVRWDLDKLQICAKGKSILEFHSVWKGNPKNSKNPKN